MNRRLSENDLEKKLTESLTAFAKPSPELNRRIIHVAEKQEKESEEIMRYPTRKYSAAAAIVFGILLIGGITTYAANRFMTPAEVAEEAGNQALADSFEKTGAADTSSDAARETQESDGFRVTFLGTTTGEYLEDYIIKDESNEDSLNDISRSRTYAILALEKKGESITLEENKAVTPLINGEPWMTCSSGTMNGSLVSFVQNNILYQVFECDDLEIFADRGVQLGEVDSVGEGSRAFVMDEKTGVYHINPDYQKFCVLFNLPLDKSKADKRAAEEYIKSMESMEEQTDKDFPKECNDFYERYRLYQRGLDDSIKYNETDDSAFLEKYMTPVPGTKQRSSLNEEGYYVFRNENGDERSYSGLDDDIQAGATVIMGSAFGSDLNSVRFHTLTMHRDRSVTYQEYRPKENSAD